MSNRVFETGAQRDTAEGKVRMSLLPHKELERVLKRYLDGAEAYGENNWKKGMETTVLYDSAMRHIMKWYMKYDDEDHLAAAVWNILGIMWTEENKPELDNRK